MWRSQAECLQNSNSCSWSSFERYFIKYFVFNIPSTFSLPGNERDIWIFAKYLLDTYLQSTLSGNTTKQLNLNLPAKRRRRRGQYYQSIGPPVTVSGSASPGVSGGAGHSHGHGGGQPQQQHRDTGHSLGVDDGGDVRATPTFKDLIPHHHRPRPTITETRAASRGYINYYFKTSDGANSRTKPHHPT